LFKKNTFFNNIYPVIIMLLSLILNYLLNYIPSYSKALVIIINFSEKYVEKSPFWGLPVLLLIIFLPSFILGFLLYYLFFKILVIKKKYFK